MKRTAAGAGLLVALLAVAAVGVGGVAAQDDGANATAAANASLGADISSFMQASSAEAEGEVADGMFDAALNRTEDPEERRALIERRQQRLQQRQARLEDRLSAMSQNDSSDGPDVRDYALATRVNVGAAGLERSVNGTERAAQAAGLDTEALAELRSSARNLRGPEVAELARSVAGPPSARQNGPLGDVPGVNRTVGGGLPGEERPGDGADGDSRDVGNDSDARETNRGRSGEAGPPGDERGGDVGHDGGDASDDGDGDTSDDDIEGEDDSSTGTDG